MIIFSAPSGSGKTTIVQHLLKQNLGLEFSISATSRKARAHEKDGVDYYFLSPETFRKKVQENAFLEWEEVYNDQFYGTLRSEVQRIRESGKHVVFDIDVIGGVNLKSEYGKNALAVFVRPPSLEVMEQRLRKRATDDESQLARRLGKAREELEYAGRFDHILINNNLEDALKEAEQLVRNFIFS